MAERRASPPPPPPPIATPFDLWDPFGDPGALRRAADAWLRAADHLDRTSANLGEVAAAVARGWSGEAHDAFAARNRVQRDALVDAAAGFREVAAHLHAVAEELEAKNDLVQSIYVTIATTAGVSMLAGAVSFGAGFLLGSASIAANVARAQQVLAGVRAFLVASRAALATAKATRLGALRVRFAGFAAQGTVATASVKHVALDQDALDTDSWERGDLAGIGLGGAASAGLVLRGHPCRHAVAGRGVECGGRRRRQRPRRPPRRRRHAGPGHHQRPVLGRRWSRHGPSLQPPHVEPLQPGPQPRPPSGRGARRTA